MPERPTRTLAAIMFTDMVGFTALMQRDEVLAIGMRDRHRAVMQAAHDRHNGKILQYIGDGTLSIFPSAVDAVACAIAIQLELRRPPEVPIRIGIHTGDIVLEGNDAYGDGINIASRVETFALPGSVLITGKVYDYIKNHAHLPTSSLGTFRPKNVAQPVALYAVAVAGLTVPAAGDLEGKGSPSAAVRRLPRPLTSFIGRNRELAELKSLVAGHSLITLTGPGGTGKTRLSLQLAEDLGDHFRDGVYFVPLAPIREPELVASVIGQALGVAESPLRAVRDTLIDFLAARQVLLILDNFEQVVEAAGLVFTLLGRCPELKVLVTSRTVLHLRGEQEYPVQPLKLPDIRELIDVARLRRYPSIQLFLERAQAVRPGFDLDQENSADILQMCRALDGLPLAIELAAARIKLFSPRVMLEKLTNRLDVLRSSLRDLPERHQTLRQAIAWSYDLLGPAEQAFFCRLSVFSGGFTAEAVRAVLPEKEHAVVDVYDLLEALLDKSLIRNLGDENGEPRFGMLETIREFGWEKLQKTGGSSRLQAAHAAYFLQLAERAEPELTSQNQRYWLEALEADHDNLRAAIRWAMETGEAGFGLRLGAALWRFWAVRSHMIEGRQRLVRLLEMPAGKQPPQVRAKVLSGIGATINMTANPQEASPFLEESLRIYRRLGDERGIANVLNHLSWTATLTNDLPKAIALAEEALTLHEKNGAMREASAAYNNLGWVKNFQCEFPLAIGLLQQSLELRRQIGDTRGIAYVQTNLAWVENRMGRLEQAAQRVGEAIKPLLHLNDKQLLAWCYTHLGANLLDRQRLREAENSLLEANALWQEVGNYFGWFTVSCYLADNQLEKGDFPAAALYMDQATNIMESYTTPWFHAFLLRMKGRSAFLQGNGTEAIRQFQASHTLSVVIGDHLGIAETFEWMSRLALTEGQPVAAADYYTAAQALRRRLDAPAPQRFREPLGELADVLTDKLDNETLAGRQREMDRRTREELAAVGKAFLR